MNRSRVRTIAISIALVYVLVSYQVLHDSVISVNENSIFHTHSGVFMPGYALGMLLGLLGGTGWVLVGQAITFAGLYVVLDGILKTLPYKKEQ
ncbi:hypothetical protein WBG78_01835 [Chryseolinea sp. T2]|uniref:hypothetical protein n=1 Tax=Chryseolinea sp. T2 TaxID=3129255 RepID=UPI00307743BE